MSGESNLNRSKKGKNDSDVPKKSASIKKDQRKSEIVVVENSSENDSDKAAKQKKDKQTVWSRVKEKIKFSFSPVQTAEEEKQGREKSVSTESFQPHEQIMTMLRGRTVSEILVPRMDVQAVPVNRALSYYIKIAIESGYSRIPVFDEDIDDIIGILYVKDLLKYVTKTPKEFNVSSIVKPPYVVPESLGLDELLKSFLRQRIHLAVVVDEYGGVSGIVTLEDVIEEIVGEIRDEYDQEENFIQKISDGKYLIDARLSLEDAERELKVRIVNEDFDTVGGFIYHLIGRVPKKNETIEFETIRFKVLSLDGNRIRKIQVNIEPNKILENDLVE